MSLTTFARAFLAASASAAIALCRFSGTRTSFTWATPPHYVDDNVDHPGPWPGPTQLAQLEPPKLIMLIMLIKIILMSGHIMHQLSQRQPPKETGDRNLVTFYYIFPFYLFNYFYSPPLSQQDNVDKDYIVDNVVHLNSLNENPPRSRRTVEPLLHL